MKREDVKTIPFTLVALLAAIQTACGSAVAQPDQADIGFDAEWKRIQSQFPEAAKYRPVEKARTPLQDLLNWARPDATTTIYDRACRPIRVERRDDELYGVVNQQTSVEGNIKNVHSDEIFLRARIDVSCGFDESYHREKSGRWIHDDTSATGCGRSVGYVLSKVTAEAAWYNDVVVGLSVACIGHFEEEMSCIGGGRRKCTRCREWGLVAHSLEPNYGIGRSGGPTIGVKVPDPVDCSAPCPHMDLPGIRRAQDILKGHAFLAGGSDEPPFFFRTRAGCTRYRRKHPIAARDLSTW